MFSAQQSEEGYTRENMNLIADRLWQLRIHRAEGRSSCRNVHQAQVEATVVSSVQAQRNHGGLGVADVGRDGSGTAGRRPLCDAPVGLTI